MRRFATLLFAALCYLAFFISFVYFVGFLAGFAFLPTHVDKGMSAAPFTAIAIDMVLIALFGVQHSVMARPRFKAAWTRIVPVQLERSVYCLATALALFAIFALWHPVLLPVWTVTNEIGRMAIWSLFAGGFLILFISTWLISHFELFGLEQAWSHFRNKAQQQHQFRTPFFYRFVRHPIYLGFFIALWATPDMTVGHLVLATGLSLYLFIGATHEERDLVGTFGEEYTRYQANVGMILPRLGRKRA